MISGFRREVDENCALPGYYASSSGNLLPTYPETSVINYNYLLRNNPEERSSQ
jgi:hypothetical protein